MVPFVSCAYGAQQADYEYGVFFVSDHNDFFLLDLLLSLLLWVFFLLFAFPCTRVGDSRRKTRRILEKRISGFQSSICIAMTLGDTLYLQCRKYCRKLISENKIRCLGIESISRTNSAMIEWLRELKLITPLVSNGRCLSRNNIVVVPVERT